jgi:hypothetical protein
MELLDAFDKPDRPVTGFLSLARGLLDITIGFIERSPLGCVLTPVMLHWTLTIHKPNTFSALLSLARSFLCLFTPTDNTDTEVMPAEKPLGIRHRLLSLMALYTWSCQTVDNQ